MRYAIMLQVVVDAETPDAAIEAAEHIGTILRARHPGFPAMMVEDPVIASIELVPPTLEEVT